MVHHQPQGLATAQHSAGAPDNQGEADTHPEDLSCCGPWQPAPPPSTPRSATVNFPAPCSAAFRSSPEDFFAHAVPPAWNAPSSPLRGANHHSCLRHDSAQSPPALAGCLQTPSALKICNCPWSCNLLGGPGDTPVSEARAHDAASAERLGRGGCSWTGLAGSVSANAC